MSLKRPIPFDNSYAHMGEPFSSVQKPTAVKNPQLIRVNVSLADLLHISTEFLGSREGIETWSGNSLAPGSKPVATAYAGHQFGHWNPQLGDGRAVLLGEVIAKNKQRYDIQLKGSGPTPFSRMGDGLSPLGPVLREYIVSEAMAALGVATSRSLAAVLTGEKVFRDELLPGAVLTRVASSHIRVGTFQYFSAQNNRAAVEQLANHVIQRHYPSALEDNNPYLAMLNQVIERQAKLIAQWQSIGFIHGVMNTDNMLICGETVDYGPCAFMDNYDPETVYSSIDRQGRYAYQNQPAIAQWNLGWFAQSLIPLLHNQESEGLKLAQTAITNFMPRFNHHYQSLMNEKIGLDSSDPSGEELVADLLQLMQQESMDFTLTFRHLGDLVRPAKETTTTIAELVDLPQSFDAWIKRWRDQLASQKTSEQQTQEKIYSLNPAFIPRNHLVEEAIKAATTEQNFKPFHKLVDLLATPFEYNSKHQRYATPPSPEEIVTATFCGT